MGVKMTIPLKIHDVYYFVIFLVLNSLAYMLSYEYILFQIRDSKMAKLHAVVITYGAAQSAIGFLAGYCVARWCFQPHAEQIYAEVTEYV
jgi:hypothetical protein